MKCKTSPLFWKKEYLENHRTIKSYGIKEYDIFTYVQTPVAGGCIDNLKDEINLDIGFDLNLVKRTELLINLIYFHPNITSKENYEYYNNFKVDVVGQFFGIDDLDIFKEYLKKIEKEHLNFLIICSGDSAKYIIT